jgi:hypothetical protein
MQPHVAAILLAAFAGTVSADFWIGNCASTRTASTSDEIALPGSTLDCNYKG